MDNTVNIESDGQNLTVHLANAMVARAFTNIVSLSERVTLSSVGGKKIGPVEAALLVGFQCTVKSPVEAEIFYGFLTPEQHSEMRKAVEEASKQEDRENGRLFPPAKKSDSNKIESILSSMGIPCKLLSEKRGPSFTVYHLVPCDNVRVSKILNCSNDISVRLGRKVRIYQDKSSSILLAEIANETRVYPTFAQVMESVSDTDEMDLPVVLGTDVCGKSVVMDLANMPHVLVCGTTGSGKSVMVKSMIVSLMLLNSESKVGVIIADPKRVEMKAFDSFTHMMGPVLNETDEIIDVLRSLCSEMERRYSMLESNGCTDIAQLQKKGVSIPRIVFVIDELADVMLSNKKTVEPLLVRLAQKSRACGIHMILCTQRPSVDVVTGILKANIPTRIALKCSSSTDSRVILDDNGAEDLLGKGDCIVKNGDYEVRVQAPFLSNSDLCVDAAA